MGPDSPPEDNGRNRVRHLADGVSTLMWTGGKKCGSRRGLLSATPNVWTTG